MKKLIAFCLCSISLNSVASPFLVSDPTTETAVDKCVYQDGATAPVETPTVGGACRIDLATWTNGNHSLQVWFRSTLWGVDSAKVPFVLSKPATGGTGPTGVRIEP